MLKIEHLTKSYGGKVAVRDISLSISPGQIYAFIGHNGAGKTTVIKSCCGLLQFDSGEIYIDGISVKSEPVECKKRLAYLPDNPDLYEFMTGGRYINFVSDIFGVSSQRRRELTQKYAGLMGIEGELSQPISSYSHGMKQKLAIVSALVHEPKLLIMDEPFVGLDPIAAHSLKEIMRQICDQGGAIFFSTHVLEVAQKLCDRVAIIRQGSIVADGSMEDISGEGSLEEVFLELSEDFVHAAGEDSGKEGA